MATDSWGIDEGYEDAAGKWHDTPAVTPSALLPSMGIAPTMPDAPSRTPVCVLRPGQTLPLAGPAELVLEDGTRLQPERVLPPDLPLGYHELRLHNGAPTLHIIVSPGRCYLPAEWHTWG